MLRLFCARFNADLRVQIIGLLPHRDCRGTISKTFLGACETANSGR